MSDDEDEDCPQLIKDSIISESKKKIPVTVIFDILFQFFVIFWSFYMLFIISIDINRISGIWKDYFIELYIKRRSWKENCGELWS